jgi:hypothetical protein
VRREETERAKKYRDSAERLRECRETERVKRDRDGEERQRE